MLHKVLFIDRDGTLVKEPNDNYQIDHLKKICLEKDVIITLSELKKYNFIFVLLTNQDNLGTLSFPFKQFYQSHNFILEVFRSQGIIFDEILICPHSEKDNCMCRKPNLKLVEKWLINNLIDKSNSYVIGDRITDMQLADKLGINGLRYAHNKLSWKKIGNILTTKKHCSSVYRKTKETAIYVKTYLNLYKESNKINTGVNFLNHMLDQIAVHSGIYFNIKVIYGDLHIDDHHTIEDTAIVLGKSLSKLIRNSMTNFNRFGFILPMDESTASCILDISNRPYLNFNVTFKNSKIGDLSSEMVEHFFKTIVYSMKITLHITAHGKNDHHLCEAVFKSFGQALGQAIKKNKNNALLSSKGIL
ncbi:Histidine biosynthesis bifunctional protein HisB [Buchnera aphidicola (Thelaxes suberi)]|uniref:bifunctional histidinol-phosphatase/imidazoleglycerol-phosphate dehydratase HisB n=1 Tax=Buchnera aphidicola TaxID=9 RepID=UPI003464A081